MSKNKTKKTSWLSKDEVEAWLNKMGIEKYTINDDLTVDVNDHVNLIERKLNEIPIQFGIVTGTFSIYGNQLRTLKGCPTRVGRNFSCGRNKLTSLKYCPIEVGGEFVFEGNKISSLEHAPESVAVFVCYDKDIKTLKSLKTKVSDHFIHLCANLEEKIEELKHLYSYNADNLHEYQLILSPQQLQSIQYEDELRLNLPVNREQSNKKLKI